MKISFEHSRGVQFVIGQLQFLKALRLLLRFIEDPLKGDTRYKGERHAERVKFIIRLVF